MQLKEELQQSNINIDTLNRSILNRDAVISSLNQQIQQLEFKLNDLIEKEKDLYSKEYNSSSKTIALENQVSVLKRERDHFEDLMSTLKTELTELKRDNSQKSLEQESDKYNLDKSESDNNTLKSALEKLNFELFQVRKDYSLLEINSEDFKIELENERNKNQNLNNRLSELKSLLGNKDHDLLEASDTIYQLKSKLDSKLIGEKDLNSDTSYLKSELQNCKTLIDSLGDEKSSMVLKCEELERLVFASKSKIETLNFQLNSEKSENEKLVREIKSHEDNFHKLKNDLKSRELEFEKSNIKFQELVEKYQLVANSQNTFIERYDNQNLLINELESEIKLLKRRLQESADVMSSENNLKEEKLESLSKTSIKLIKAEKDIASLLEQNTALRRDLARSDADLSILKSQIGSLSMKNDGDRADFKRLIEEKESSDLKINELRELISNIEVTSRNNMYKVNKLESHISDIENEKKMLLSNNKNLKNELQGRDESIKQIRQALQTLDKERDFLQSQLDFEAEQKVNQEKVHKQLEVKIFQYKELLEKADKIKRHLEHELSSSQRNISSLDAKINSYKEENLDLKRKLSFKNCNQLSIINCRYHKI